MKFEKGDVVIAIANTVGPMPVMYERFLKDSNYLGIGKILGVNSSTPYREREGKRDYFVQPLPFSNGKESWWFNEKDLIKVDLPIDK